MSTFGGKADMTFRGSPLLRSLLGQSGHDLLRRICLLLTQSGHCVWSAPSQSQSEFTQPLFDLWEIESEKLHRKAPP